MNRTACHRRARNSLQNQRLSTWVVLALCVGLARTIAAAEATPVTATTDRAISPDTLSQHWPLFAVDVAGQRVDISAAEAPALVLVFLGTECPISNRYAPELNRLADDARQKRLPFYGVLSDAMLSRAEAQRFVAEHQLSFPVIFDPSLEFAYALQPTHVPESFVLTRDGQLVYRGRIDDRWVAVGKSRPEPTSRDLAEVLAAIAAGTPPTPRATEPVGCRYEALSTATGHAEVTFHRHVAPLVWHHCATCHRAGEVAPFSLTSYEDVAKRPQQIADVVAGGLMPPWRAAAEVGHFRGARRMTPFQRELLARWAECGAPAGDPADSPPLPAFPEGWQLGTPDLILRMPAAYKVPAEGNNLLRWFPLPCDLPDDQFVAGFEFHPGNRRVVHHAVMFIDDTRVSLLLDALHPGPGYEQFGGPGFLPSGYLGSWGPGFSPRFLPEGTGIRLRRRAVIALQMHYTPTGKPETDLSEIGLYFAKRSDLRSVLSIPLMQVGFEIAAGAAAHQETGSFVLPVPVTVIGLAPHMHYLGREMRVSAVLPEGERRELIWVRDWDFNWQDAYQLSRPVELPAGTRLEVTGIFDNTANNPKNPFSPPRLVKYGQQSADEMCLAGVQVALHNQRDFARLVGSLVRQYLQSQDGKPFVNPFE